MLVHEDLSRKIIGAAITVHRELGPGLLESAYQECLKWECIQAGLVTESQVSIPLKYKDAIFLDCGYRADFIIERKVVIEIKSVEKVLPIHESQLFTYMRLTKMRLGFLLNFNVSALRDGGIIRRVL